MKRFRYALEPVLLTRRWDLDGLMLELGEQNAALAAHQAVIAAADARFAAASGEWRALTAGGAAHAADRFAMLTRYLGELSRQGRENAVRLTELQAARDDVAARVMAAQRAVEAAEQHRADCKALFMQERASADFKLADDQWNMLQTGAIAHDN